MTARLGVQVADASAPPHMVAGFQGLDRGARSSAFPRRQADVAMSKTRALAVLGALFYVAWSLLHLQSAIAVFHLGGRMPPSPGQARVLQDAWNLLFFSVVTFVTAVSLSWRNSRLGYWINLCVVAAADVGFIIYLLAPGYVPLWPGALGPGLWALGWGFSTWALLSAPRAGVRGHGA